MLETADALDLFRDVVKNVPETLEHYRRELKRPLIGVLPAYFPLEWVIAAGGYPVQVWGNSLPPGRSDGHLQAFTCSMARSALELELTGGAKLVDGYAFISICDTLGNLREIYRRVVGKPDVSLEIPQARSADARHAYLKLLIEKMESDLEAITGRRPTPDSLREAGVLVGRTRELQREFYTFRRASPAPLSAADFYTVMQAGYFLPADEYNRRLCELLDALRAGGARASASAKGDGVRLVLSGMYIEPDGLYREIFDPLGVHIVDDDFANGWRTVSRKTLSESGDDPVRALETMLFSGAPCSCIHDPSKNRGAYLVEKARAARADGVLVVYQKFCEPEAFDRPDLINALKDAGIPATFVEVEMFMRNFEQLKNRVSAFCEMIED